MPFLLTFLGPAIWESGLHCFPADCLSSPGISLPSPPALPLPDLRLSFPSLSVHQGPGGEQPVPNACQARGLCVAGDPGDGHLQPSQPAAPVHHVCELRPEVSVRGPLAWACAVPERPSLGMAGPGSARPFGAGPHVGGLFAVLILLTQRTFGCSGTVRGLISPLQCLPALFPLPVICVMPLTMWGGRRNTVE